MTYTSLARRPLSISRVGALSGIGRSGSATPADSTTFLALTSSGASRLPSDVTINSATVAPSARYEGASLTGTDGTWPGIVGPTLTNTGAGNSVVAAFAPFTGGDGAVAFANGKSMLAAASAPATAAFDLSTNDFVITLVVVTTAATGGVIRKGASPIGPPNPGWEIALTPTTAVLSISDGATLRSITATLAASSHNVVQFYVDRSEASANGAHAFVNGVLSSSSDFSAAAASISAAASDLIVGSGHTGAVTYFAIHQRAAWFPGGASNAAQFLVAAREASSRLEGTYAATAVGTATPVAMTRSTGAYLDRVVADSPFERRLFLVGANWERLCRRQELAGGEAVTGVVVESQATNLCLRSEEFDNASWTAVAATISGNARPAPNGETAADGIIGSAANVQHGATQAVTLTAAGYIASFFVEAGDQSFAYIENATIANGRVWFDLSTGAVGTTQAGITEALIEPYGLGRYRVSARFTGTVAAHTIGIYAASADNVASFVGDGATVNLWVWGAQVETTVGGGPSSYVVTTSATVTRTLDTLQYKMDDGNFTTAAGTLSAEILSISRDLLGDWMVALCSASSGSVNDSVYISPSSADVARAISLVGGAFQFNISGTTDVVDGERHTIAATYTTNEGKLLVDGAQQGATDTSVTVLGAAPAVLTVGQFAGSQTANALIGNIRIRNTVSP